VTFPQGPPPAAHLAGGGGASDAAGSDGDDGDAAASDRLAFAYLGGEGRKAERRVVTATSARVKYEGRNFGDDVQKGAYK
jgi:hypothetical protein